MLLLYLKDVFCQRYTVDTILIEVVLCLMQLVLHTALFSVVKDDKMYLYTLTDFQNGNAFNFFSSLKAFILI